MESERDFLEEYQVDKIWEKEKVTVEEKLMGLDKYRKPVFYRYINLKENNFWRKQKKLYLKKAEFWR